MIQKEFHLESLIETDKNFGYPYNINCRTPDINL